MVASKYFGFAITFILLLSACSLISPIEMPETKRYVINQLPHNIKVRRHKSPKTILVLSSVANPGFGTHSIAYIRSPYRIEHYRNSSWLALPSEMVRSVIANTLKNTRYFHAVLEQPEYARTDYRLSSRIIKFQQELFKKVVKVRIILQVDLISNQNSKVAASHIFQETKQVQDKKPYRAVLAFNEIMSKLAGRISKFVIANV